MNIKDYLHLEWRPIPGYDGYEASNTGDIRSLDKEVKHNYGGRATKKGKILSKHISDKGYYQVGLTVDGKTKTIKNAILTCKAWHENPLNKKTVNHKDTNKLNDNKDNLEWNTQQENVMHAIKNNCRKSFKLSKSTVDKIVVKSKKRVTVTDIQQNKHVTISSVNNTALLLRVKQSTVSQALKRNSLISKRYKVSYASPI